MTKPSVNIFWFRRDLRLHDNAGLWHALRSDQPILPVFIFDRRILDKLSNKADQRLQFINDALEKMQSRLKETGSSLEILYGFPEECFRQLWERYDIKAIYTNRDYEPYANERDGAIEKWAGAKGIAFHTYKDQVIFDRDEVLKDDGKPYTVFTPYSKRWKAKLTAFYLLSYPTEKYFDHFYRHDARAFPNLASMGFELKEIAFPSIEINESLIHQYSDQRDFPALEATSRMGVHLRFGTASIRELCRKVMAWNDSYLNELIWREFYQMILSHFPTIGMGKSFKQEYDWIEWRNNEDEFEKWCQGKTGYPIVDAGMRELNSTGYMHNRVRMIVASFLTKHLLIDWRWGEAYFAEKLLDFDLAANNGGWQWAAGSGCDAVPYFRIFNPYLQTKKFDPELKYIRKWVTELEEFSYPRPMVEHEFARKRALEVYGKALKRKTG